VIQRYARQERLPGWKQQHLTESIIAISGSGPMAFLTALMAAAMGFGRIILLHGPDPRSPRSRAQPGVPPPSEWAHFLGQTNPDVTTYPCSLTLCDSLGSRLPQVNAIIVAGSDRRAWSAGTRLACERDAPVFAGAAAGPVGIWGRCRDTAAVARMRSHPESPVPSQIAAALLVEQVRRSLGPLPDEPPPVDACQAFTLSRPVSGGRKRHRPGGPSGHNLALVGAGALGTWFGIGLGVAGGSASLRIYDHDRVDETNLNRQILFYESVGKPKAPVLAQRLQDLFPNLRTAGYGMRVTPESDRHLAVANMLVACPDNFGVRALLNDLASHRPCPLLNGGSSAQAGSCMIYEPGQSACLSCRMDIDRLAERERAPQSCGRQPEASVVTSNAITGALMVWCLQETMAGRPPAGTWSYDGSLPGPCIGMHSARPACKCHLS